MSPSKGGEAMRERRSGQRQAAGMTLGERCCYRARMCGGRNWFAARPAQAVPMSRKPVDTLAVLEVGYDDLVDILRRGRAIPDSVGIDNQQRTRVTKAKAARHRETDISEVLRFDRLAHPIPEGLRPRSAATAVRMIRRTLRVAGKDVMPIKLRKLEFGFCVHAPILKSTASII